MNYLDYRDRPKGEFVTVREHSPPPKPITVRETIYENGGVFLSNAKAATLAQPKLDEGKDEVVISLKESAQEVRAKGEDYLSMVKEM